MTTVPDSNVRFASRVAAESSRVAGHSVLARLLLFVLDHISKLDRKLLLLLFASPMSACIIPAGPQFQDPAGVPDSPPFLLAVSPDEGSTTTKDTFTVTPSDINVGDDLYVIWLTEYPPLTGSSFVSNPPSMIQHSDDGSPLAQSRMFSPTCYQVNRALSTHQIMAAISDSPFVSDNGLLATESGTRPIQVVWTWVKNCTAGPP